MGKLIDISARLTNERPTLKLAEGKVYEIDDRKNTILQVNQKMQSQNLEDLSVLDEILKLTLGKTAAQEIDGMNLSFSGYQSIIIAIMAAVIGEDFEVAEARFRRAQDRM